MGSQAASPGFASKIERHVGQVLLYEDPVLQARALSLIPVDRLNAEAQEAVDISRQLGDNTPAAFEDFLAESLVGWFKQEFFSWVNKPACWNCGNDNTVLLGVTQPSESEAKHDASRVEVYNCPKCGATSRFPRYNDPGKLLETRKGRCGEWANVFTLCSRALQLDTRLVVDWTDHVWNEYFSQQKQRWVHLDCCEAAYDKPMLYEAGWGKKLTYAVAFDKHGVTDVTRRYTRDWQGVLSRRREAGEEWLVRHLRERSQVLRQDGDEDVLQLALRDAQEETELDSTIGQGLSPEDTALPGRTTGSEEWRRSRGEVGNAAAPARVDRPAGTRYRIPKRAKQAGEGAPEDGSNCLCGGAVRGSGENAPAETVDKLFDGREDTKWLDFGGGGRSGSAWVEYCLMADQPSVALAEYAVTSANDAPERDPQDWVLVGMPEAGDEGKDPGWVELDKVCGARFEGRHTRRQFQVKLKEPPRCRRFRLRIQRVRDPAAANSVQVSRLDLFGV